MRTLMQVVLPVQEGNKAIQEGSLGPLLEKVFARIQPEAAYFTSLNGKRTALVVFDMKHQSDIPAIAEPFFLALNAEVTFLPAMTLEDVKQGLSRLG